MNPPIDPPKTHEELQEELIAERNRLCAYILKGAKHRCKLIRQGHTNKAIMAEVAVSAVFLRPDLTENLIERGHRIAEIEAKLEELDRQEYADRFKPDS